MLRLGSQGSTPAGARSAAALLSAPSPRAGTDVPPAPLGSLVGGMIFLINTLTCCAVDGRRRRPGATRLALLYAIWARRRLLFRPYRNDLRVRVRRGFRGRTEVQANVVADGRWRVGRRGAGASRLRRPPERTARLTRGMRQRSAAAALHSAGSPGAGRFAGLGARSFAAACPVVFDRMRPAGGSAGRFPERGRVTSRVRAVSSSAQRRSPRPTPPPQALLAHRTTRVRSSSLAQRSRTAPERGHPGRPVAFTSPPNVPLVMRPSTGQVAGVTAAIGWSVHRGRRRDHRGRCSPPPSEPVMFVRPTIRPARAVSTVAHAARSPSPRSLDRPSLVVSGSDARRPREPRAGGRCIRVSAAPKVGWTPRARRRLAPAARSVRCATTSRRHPSSAAGSVAGSFRSPCRARAPVRGAPEIPW